MPVIYSKNGCPQCKMVKRWLTENGVDFIEKNVSENESYIEEVKERGYNHLPLTVVGETEIAGFAPSVLQSVFK
jgi:glutaredoxin-like protein NrdH